MNARSGHLQRSQQPWGIYHGSLRMANNREDLVTYETSWYNVKRFERQAAKCLAEGLRQFASSMRHLQTARLHAAV